MLRCYRELVGVHVLTLALMVVNHTVDGQLPEDSVTCAWDADLQQAGMLDRTRRVSRSLAKTRRDESANTSGAAEIRCGRLCPGLKKRTVGKPVSVG